MSLVPTTPIFPPGRSTDCRSRSTPAACNRELDLDALMRTIARSGRPGILWVRLLGRQEGSASAFRVNSLCQRTEDVKHIAEDVRVDVLL